MAGVNIGKIYPGMQSGTSTLVAGSLAVTFSPAFKQVPNVTLGRLTIGTMITELYAGGVSATGFTALSREYPMVGGTFIGSDMSGTTAVTGFNWLAHVDN